MSSRHDRNKLPYPNRAGKIAFAAVFLQYRGMIRLVTTIYRGLIGLCLSLLICAPVICAQEAKVAPEIRSIQKRIQKSGADVAVAFRTLDGKSEWYFRRDEVFHAASTMKIPVMIELFHQGREGKLTLDDTLPIKNEFHSLVDGSVFALDPKDDSEVDLYKAVGQTRTLRQLCELMITVSSNFATNLLIDKLGVENIRATVHSLGAEGMNVQRGVEDAAIVYAQRPYVLVVLVRGVPDFKKSGRLIAAISRDIYRLSKNIHPSVGLATSNGSRIWCAGLLSLWSGVFP